jgi:large subunit ribosomal protein L25
MSHETPTIQARPRDRRGSRYSQRLRKEGRLPAIIYGHKIDPLPVSIDEKEILDILRHGAHALTVAVEGGVPQTCLVKDLQFGYLGDNVIHIDFTRVDLDEEVTVHVHLIFAGTPKEALKAGTILTHDQSTLAVRCKVRSIPDELRVDLSTMTGNHFPASQIALPPGVTLADPPDTIVASISYVRGEETTAESAEVAPATAEPEVIGAKPAEEVEGT